MTLQSFTVLVRAPVGGGGGGAYTLPSSGQAVAIGTNTVDSTTPNTWTAAAWSAANFDSYGGGTFVPTYSARGAYVIAGSGGHSHSDNYDALVFDFTTATWTRLQNANGVNLKAAGGAITVAQTNDAPNYEIKVDGSGNPSTTGTASQVPAPGHPYNQLVYVPDGTLGSVLYFGRAAVCELPWGAQATHRFDLSTRLWSRYSAALNPRVTTDLGSVYDAARGRVWFGYTFDYTSLGYLDLADRQAKTLGSFSTPSGAAFPGAFVVHGNLLLAICPGGTNLNSIWAIDGDAPTGWTQLTHTGTFPTTPNHRNRWIRYSNGNYYSMLAAGGNTVYRLRPPANPLSGTWIVDTVSITGATMPPRYGVGDGNAHYSLLCYVPAIDCLAWVPGGSASVYLFKPGS